MSKFTDMSLSSFLEEIRCKPVPAGGCLVAYNALMCISLINKVLRVTKRRLTSSEDLCKISECEEIFSRLSSTLLSLMDKDVENFNEFIKIKRDTPLVINEINKAREDSNSVLVSIKEQINKAINIVNGIKYLVTQHDIKADFDLSLELLTTSFLSIDILITENER